MSAHSPTPWHLEIDPFVDGFAEPIMTAPRHGIPLFEVYPTPLNDKSTVWTDEQKANARFIVRAVNNFSPLLKALRQMRHEWGGFGELSGETIELADRTIRAAERDAEGADDA